MPKLKVKKIIVPNLDAETIKKLKLQVDAEESEVQNYEDEMEKELNQVGLDEKLDEEIDKQINEETNDSKDLKSKRRDA